MKLKKIILITSISFITIVIIGLLFLPIIGKNYLVNNSKELVGRKIELNKLKVNYFTGTIQLFDFKMLEENEDDLFLKFDTLRIDLEPYKMFSDEFVMEQFYLQGLTVNTIQKDSIFNFDDLIAFHTSNTETDSVPSTEPLKYSLSNIEFKDATFNFNNKNIEHIAELKHLSFFVPFIGWDQNHKSEAGIKFNLSEGGYFESDLKVDPKSGDYEAEVTVHQLHLNPFLKYIQEYANINSIEGLLNTTLKATGNVNEVANSIITGNTQVYNFAMNDTLNKKFLAVEKLNCIFKEINYAENSYRIDSLNLDTPYVYFQLDSISNNLFKIFKIDTEAETTETDTISTNSSPIYYAINHFGINNGITDYTDNLTGNPFNYHLSEITIASDSILSDSDWVTIYSTMLLNERGTLNAEVGFNPINPMYANIDVSIEKFKLPDINIYTDYYMGHTILEGDMYYYSNSKITDGAIESENKLLVKNASLNNTQKGLYSLPLKFALFILTDKNGDVNLDIPVRGDLNDPTIDVKKIVWTTFKNLIVKAATSPGKLLAGLVGGKAEDIEVINFNYLDTIPSEKNKKQLDLLLDLEQKKEGLTIELVYYVDPDLQQQAIAKAEVGKMYFKETQKDYLKDEKDFESFVLQKTLQDSLALEKAYLTIANPIIVDSIAQVNNKLLLNNIENYLQTANDSTIIKVQTSNPEAPENTGTKPILKVNFSMKEEE